MPKNPNGKDEDLEKKALAERARLLFSAPVTFFKSVVSLDGLPGDDLPEVAFAGRSNVGKSSLLNAVCNQKDLARTSNTPGRTQQINYFEISRTIYLVDLPGYGYAKAPKGEVNAWNTLVRLYLKGRASLKRVFLLIDSRHGLKENDVEIMRMLDEAAVVYQIVLTKVDKIKETELKRVLARTFEEIKKHTAAYPAVLTTSSQKNTGLDAVREVVTSFC